MSRAGEFRQSTLCLTLAVCLLGSALPYATRATERGASHYTPGGSRQFAVAVAPAPGLRVASELRFDYGQHDMMTSFGALPRAETFRAVERVEGFYSFEKEVLGGHIEVGATFPLGYAGTEAAGTSNVGRFDIGDLELVPLAWSWNHGQLHLRVQETIYAPTGGFDSSRLSNLGLNYWSFDSSLAATWFNDGSGSEISLEAGVLSHTRNPDTKYQSGNEFHVDFRLNQFWTPAFAFGASGYYYDQLDEDRSFGTRLTRTEARALGVGASLLWSPLAFDRRLTLVASWLHDLETTRRSNGEHARLTLTFTP